MILTSVGIYPPVPVALAGTFQDTPRFFLLESAHHMLHISSDSGHPNAAGRVQADPTAGYDP